MAATLEVLDEVGRGGTCVVHRGVLRGEHGTGRPVAVKRLLPERRVDPTSVDLFVQEAKLATRLNHPRILQAFELRKDEDGYLLLYEWIDGCTLDAIPGPWSAGQVATVGRAVCEALSYLHTLRDGAIVHRDVSPSNVFITRAGGVKLGDLGVAYCVDSTGPVPQAITRGFGAPEQLAQGRVDARADVYALGKTLLTLTDDSKLIGVLERATQDSPEARFESADALSSSLGEASETVSPQEIAALLDAPAPRPVLDHAVRSILGGSLEPASEAQATPVEAPEPVARADTRSNVRANVRGEGSARWLGLAPWIAAALLTSAGVWWSQQRRPSAQPNEATAQTESPSSPRPSPAPSAQDRERTPPDVPPSGSEQPVESKEQAKQRVKPPTTVPGTVPITVTRGSSASAKNGAPEAARSALTVGCTPWAEVTLDGKPLGNTPLRRVSVPTGAHTLELRHPPSGRSKRLELTVADDMTVIVNLNSDEVRFK